MRAIIFHGKSDENYVVEEIPSDLLGKVKKLREELIDNFVEYDEATMEKYLAGKELAVEEIKKCIRKGVISSKFYPVLCGTALKNKVVKTLLDEFVDYLLSPNDVPPINGRK